MQTTMETRNSRGKPGPQVLHRQQRTVVWDLGALTGRHKGQHTLQRCFFIHSLILQIGVVLSAMCRPLTSGLEQQRMNGHALCPHRAASHFCENCVYVKTLQRPAGDFQKGDKAQKEARVLRVLWVEAKSERNCLITVTVFLWSHSLGRQQRLKRC